MAEKVVDQITELWNEFTKAHNASEIIDAKRFERLTRKEVKSIISDITAAKELNGFVATKLNEQVTKLNALINQKQPKGDASHTFDDEDILFDMVNRNLWMYEQLLKALREYFGHDTSDSALVYAGTRDDWKEACKDAGEFIEFERRMAKFTSMILAAGKASAKLDVMFDDLLGVLKGGDRFTALPNEIIYRVLEYIALGDLCAVSRSCKRLQELSGDFFQRKYPYCFGWIGKLANGRIGFRMTEEYVACFNLKLQRIVLDFDEMNDEMNDELLQFMRKNCGKNIKQITFVGEKYSKLFLEGIKTVLNNVETIIISTRGKQSNIRFDVILNDLPLLKHLQLRGYLAEIGSLKRVKCSQLNSLTCDIKDQIDPDTMKIFFQQNPTVTRFECSIMSDRVFGQILTVVTQSANLEELIIRMDANYYTDFACIRNQLKVLDERENFKRFHLDIFASQVKNLFELVSMKSFSFLRLRNSGGFIDMEQQLPTLNLMVNLEVLELRSEFINETIAVSLSKNLTNLKKLALAGGYFGLTARTKLNSMDVLKPFVRNMPKLTEIELKHCVRDGNELTSKIQVLIGERKKLKNAGKLVIFITRLGQTIPPELRKNSNDDLVVVKKV